MGSLGKTCKSFFISYLFVLAIIYGCRAKINTEIGIQVVNISTEENKVTSTGAYPINLTDPKAEYLASIDHYYGKISDVVTFNNLIYAVTECGDLLVFEFANFNSEIIGIWENKLFSSEIGDTTCANIRIVIRNLVAYISLFDLGLVLIDISNPYLPKFFAHYQDIITHDMALYNDNLFVYYSNYPDIKRITIYNIDTIIPIFQAELNNDIHFIREIITSHGYICKRYTNITKLFEYSGNGQFNEIVEFDHYISTMAIQNELLIYCSSDYQMWFYNISNISSPIFCANFSLPYYYYHGTTISGNLVYIWNWWDVLTINFSDLLAPHLLGEFDGTFPQIRLLTLNGFNEINDDRIILFMNLYSGLFIFNFTNANNPSSNQLYSEIYMPRTIEVCNNLLLVGYNEVLEIYSVKDPKSPSLKSQYKASGFIFDILLSESVVFLAVGEAGIEIINIKNRSNPIRIGYFNNFTIHHFNGDYSLDLSLDIENMNLYISRGYSGITILDISDYSNPYSILEFQPSEFVTSKMVIYHKGRLYIGTAGTDWNSGGLKVFDVIDPRHPKLVYSIHGVDSIPEFYIEGNYLYMFICDWTHELRIYDLDNEITYFSNISSVSGLYYASDIFVMNNIAFLASGYDLTIIDVIDKRNPKIIDTYKGQSSTSYLKNIKIDKDILYINEGLNGIQIFRLENWGYETINLISKIPMSLLLCFIFILIKRRKNIG